VVEVAAKTLIKKVINIFECFNYVGKLSNLVKEAKDEIESTQAQTAV
jgi:hypothetical protein